MSAEIVDPALPRLSAARAPLTREVTVLSADGERRRIALAAERALALYVDNQELVTLMTLGQEPELLALGYLLNQGLVERAEEVDSITVDWEVAAAAVRTRHGVSRLQERIARRTVTTGCGQGTVFGDWLERVPPLPEARCAPGSVAHEAIVHILDAMRRHPGIHRDAGSVHGTALWRAGAAPGDERRAAGPLVGEQRAAGAQVGEGRAAGAQVGEGRAAGALVGEERAGALVHVEDVGRHNAVDTVAGWMAMQRVDGAGCWLYTTGRLTSEMVLKAAWLRVPVVVSRNGATAMGQELAEKLNLTLIGRASGRRYLCYSGAERLRCAAG